MTESVMVGNFEEGQSKASAPLGILDALILLARNKRLIVGLSLSVGLLATLVSLLIPNSYMATTKILPPQQGQSGAAAMAAQLGGLLGGAAGGIAGIKNPNDLYVGMLRSRTVADEMIRRFDLIKRYEKKKWVEARAVLKTRTTIGTGKDGLITIDVEDRDPKFAAALANGYIDELYKLTQRIAVTEASQKRVFFERQMGLAKDQLAKAEVQMRDLQERTGLIRLDDQSRASIETIANLRGQISAKELQIQTMATFATEKNPDVQFATSELEGLKKQLEKLQTPESTDEVFIATKKIPRAGLEFVRMLREVKYRETIFEVLAKQFEIAKVEEGKNAALIQVLDKALEPERKSSPKRALICMFALAIGALLGVVFVFVRDWVEKSKKNESDAARWMVLRQHLWSR
ncbi:hypothetical protein FNU76_04845 [Chitinimonas arctica]|uniref:Lipopolysaccharide biosynthesis protein n=1 Tax=Chitinimonas arctica TaxID=2594795 RepID=A0A516SC54_9NEIS|nr:GNVR domain-containing protein [Chitinimonas arctica]QDQ25730.1 hypothetical protein FNU76_04845 [Chitinimonas arctica]